MISKLIISLIQIAITFVIKIYLMNEITLTGQSDIDKIIFSAISILLIILTIKNFIDISIAKKDKEKLSVWAQLAIFVVLMGCASIIWYLMNYYIFWVVIGAFLISFIIVQLKSHKEIRLKYALKKEVKKALSYNYNLSVTKLKFIKKYKGNIIKFGEQGEYFVIIFDFMQDIDEDNVYDCLPKSVQVLKNEDGEIISQMKDFKMILLISDMDTAIKIYNKILKQIKES